MSRRDATLLLVSAAVLADEVVLVRAFSIGQWYHFAYMVISIALLGFGASGTLLAALAQRKTNFAAAGAPRVYSGWFALSATVFALALPVSFALAQKIPFDPFLIVWDRQELLYLGCYYLVLFVPFFAAATTIGLAFLAQSEESPRIYFYNLVGSAAGAALPPAGRLLAPRARDAGRGRAGRRRGGAGVARFGGSARGAGPPPTSCGCAGSHGCSDASV